MQPLGSIYFQRCCYEEGGSGALAFTLKELSLSSLRSSVKMILLRSFRIVPALTPISGSTGKKVILVPKPAA
jgi:hypothetical protein